MTRSLNASVRLAIVVFAGGYFCLGLGGCSSKPTQSQTQQPAAQAAAGERRFNLKGKVVSVDKEGKKLVVDHEAIPGFMGAMTMGYPVKDEKALEPLAAGDQVTAQVVSSGSEYWLENIVVAKKE